MLLLTLAGPNKTHPLLTKSIEPALVDYIVKEKLFNFFMFNMCIPGTAEHRPVLPQTVQVLGSWLKPCGTRLGIRKGGNVAVRLPKILVFQASPKSCLGLYGAHS